MKTFDVGLYAQQLTHVAKAENKRKEKPVTTLEQQRREIATVEVTHLENAADAREKEDCSSYSSLNDRVRSTAIVQARTSMNERQSNSQVLTLMHTIKHSQYPSRYRNQQIILSTRIL